MVVDGGSRMRRVIGSLLTLAMLTVGPVLASGGSGTASARERGAAADRRPNVVVVMADDMRTDELQFMPKTRRIFGRHGLTFENSFSANPMCCPARASFLTGEYSHNHKVFSSLDPYGFRAFDDSYTMATALHASGYRTALVGKYLNGYGKQRSKVTGQPSLHYVPRGYTDWYASVEPPEGSGLGGTYHYDHVTYNHNGAIDDGHRGEYSTVGISRISRRLIEKYAGPGRPFFLWASFIAPHEGLPVEPDDPHYPTPARPPWVRGHFNDVITRAPGVPRGGGPIEADMRDKPKFMRALKEPNARGRQSMRDGARQRAESLYVLDREVGHLVSTLRRSGEWDNTVLMFLSDNGYFIGEHRKRSGKVLGYEPSIRVPILVTGPGMRTGERRYDPISLVDLTATILDLGDATRRLSRRHPLDGTSRLPVMLDGDVGWTSPVVTEGHMWNHIDRKKARRLGFHGRGLSYIGIRTARYSLIRTVRGSVELYDLADDANEMRSRHDDPSYRRTKRQLTRVWKAFSYCSGDDCRHPLPEGLQADPATERDLTTSFWRQVDAVHGY